LHTTLPSYLVFTKRNKFIGVSINKNIPIRQDYPIMKILLFLLAVIAVYSQLDTEDLPNVLDQITGQAPPKCSETDEIKRIRYMIDQTPAENGEFVNVLNNIFEESMKLCKALKDCEKVQDAKEKETCSLNMLGEYLVWGAKLAKSHPKEHMKFTVWNEKLKKENLNL